MNKKLKRLGISLPLLPLTTVGSFPKPDYLKKIRASFEKKSRELLLRNAEVNATKYWMKMQERIGFDILAHGEMERGDMVEYFGEELDGFSLGDKKEPVRSFGNQYWVPPEIIGKIIWKKPMSLWWWQFAQLLTEKPVKGMLTGPATIYDWSLDGYYGSRQGAVMDIAHALRREIEALIEAGVKVIQIDEPSLAQTPKYFETLLEAFHIMLDDVSEQAYFIMHTCYGEDVFETLYPRMLELPVDNLDLETANSGMKFLHTIARHPITKDISLGFVDVHKPDTETVAEVAERIRLALGVVPKERLWIGPDCGLKTRTVKQAEAKLVVLRAARDLVTIAE